MEGRKKMEIKDLKRYINEAESKAWHGSPYIIKIITNDEVIEIEGYIIESGYESFTSASKISLNDECLFGTDARNVSSYHNEVYSFGKFKYMDEALNYVIEILKNKDYKILRK